METSSPPPSVTSAAPTPEEQAAKDAAQNSKLNALQQTAGEQTDRLFRIFGASAALAGGSAPIASL